MEDYLINQWYFAPIWIVNTINFGNIAYKNFKEMRYDSAKVLPALWFSAASAAAVVLTGICVADGLEKLLK
jgi:hypothetical protein